ncbi:MAG: NADH:flavin oxidoreductase [Promethearchaeota archaeon]
MNIGKIEVKNRFVRSAVVTNLAHESGEVSEQLIKLFSVLAKGEIGLIITGFMYVHPLGQISKNQTGIHNDDLIPSLKRMVNMIHREDGKVAFQIGHGGLQTHKAIIGSLPLGPSKQVMNPITFTKPKEMTEEDIQESIESFIEAARRAVEAGADAIQLHGAHGYLINQFLSPFYNRRKDKWGGTDENRFKYTKEIIINIKKVIPRDMALLLKLNTVDYTPGKGINIPLACKYAKWLKKSGIDGIEVSAGSTTFSIFNMCRGTVPVKEFTEYLPDKIKPLAEKSLLDMKGKFELEEGYNVEAAKEIKKIIGKLPIIVVGGLRNKAYFEEIIEKGFTDFISMARPFIREPYLVKSFKEGKQEKAACISCNRCLAAISNGFPVRCYVKK